MNNRSYYSQYKGPNIVIVPTMSCNPSSAKRQKLNNNIVVPIVNNVACENQKLKLSEESSRTDNSITCKKLDNNETKESSSTIPKSLKGSWAANYLQSIGLDKKSSIWDCKIPRKTASQRCGVTVEPSKKSTEDTPISTHTTNIHIENSNQSNISNKIITDLNTLKDSNNKIKCNVETQNRFIKVKSKESKQLNQKSKKPVSVKNTSGSKINNTLNLLDSSINVHKNNNIINEQNKIRTYNTKKNKSVKEPIKLSGNHEIHIKTEKIINTTSQKDRNKFPTVPASKSYRQRCQNIVEKSNMRSVDVKKNVEDSRKSSNKTRHTNKQTTMNDSTKLPVKSSCSNYKEKFKNSKFSKENVTSINNIKIKKNHDKHNDLNNTVLKKAQHITELKTKVVRNKAEVRNITKTKEKSLNSESDLKSAKKTIKSPIKRKPSKTKRERKIKIVINLICNQNSNSVQAHETASNESNDSNTTSTVPNVDLDFLNDFDIDGIVESLDICEKKQSDRNLNNCQSKRDTDKDNIIYKNNTDAIDLLKTLKGEEDDDLMRISIENRKDLLISEFVNNITPDNEKSHNNLLDIVSKNNNGITLKSSCQILVKTEGNEGEGEVSEQSSNAAGNSSNVMINENITPVHVVETYTGIAKGTQEISFKKQLDVSSGNGSQSAYNSIERGTSVNLSNELMKRNKSNTQIIEEKNISPFVGDAGSSSVFNKINTDSNKEFKLDKNVTENMNKAKCDYISIPENKLTNDNSQVLKENVENLYIIDQNDKPPNDTLPKKTSADNNNKIVDEKNTIHTCSNNKDIDFTNKNEENGNAAYNLHQLKPEKLDNKCLVNAGEHETSNNDEESTKIKNKYIKNTDEENTNITSNSLCKSFSQQVNVNVETKHSQNNVALVSNKVKDETIGSCIKSQENRDNGDKVQSKVEECLMKNKQKDIPDTKNGTIGSQKQLSVSDEHKLGNTKTKDDQHSILEQRLLTCTRSKYSIICSIHNGKYSKIFKCKHPNGKYYALKMLTTNIEFNSGKQKTYMLDSLISDIPKENLFIICLVKSFNMGNKWCFLMEYYPKNLDQMLSMIGKPLFINQIQDYARQLVMAVMVLRNKNMVHLDIKPTHILINSSNNMLKLCGFDTLCSINHMKVLPNTGTVSYRAPEVILGYKSHFGIDVWSTGLVLYEMATNKKLFPGMYNNDILYKQMCTLGVVPYKMIRKSRFGCVHFIGWKFMRKSGFKGRTVSLIAKFNKNNKLRDSIYTAYFQNWGGNRSKSQQTSDMENLNLFVKLLQKMLVIHPETRLPIEFVYSNPFIYDVYSYQKW